MRKVSMLLVLLLPLLSGCSACIEDRADVCRPRCSPAPDCGPRRVWIQPSTALRYDCHGNPYFVEIPGHWEWR